MQSETSIVKKILNLNRSVALSFLYRSWSALSGIVTIYLSARYLDAATQGVYYSFASLIAIQNVAELGVSFSVTQFCSHEMAKLTFDSDGIISGDSQSKARLKSVLLFAVSWFRVAAVVFIIVILPAGLFFFHKTISVQYPDIHVTSPWCLLVIFSGSNLFISGLIAMIEGCGKINDVLHLKIIQSGLALSFSWIVLVNSGGLYAMVTVVATTSVVSSIWLGCRYKTFFKDLLSKTSESSGINWKNEMWPFQSRMAVSWIAGFLTFQLINPIVLTIEGPVITGQLGMSLQIFAGLNSIVLAWITSNLPNYGYLIASGQRQELDRIFFGSLIGSTILLFFLLASFILGIYIMRDQGVKQCERLLNIKMLILLGLGSIASHITHAEALYLRSHKKEPFLLVSIIAGVTMILGLLIAVPKHGVVGAVWIYLFVMVGIGLCLGSLTFRGFRRQYN
jgi:hypothetical protein